MKSLLIIFVMGIFVFASGCAKLAGVMATPGMYENKDAAAFNLAEKKPKRLLVLVSQPGGVVSEVNIRMYLSKMFETLLVEKVELKKESIIPYDEVAKYRQAHPDFTSLTPFQAAKALNADMVLYVVIDNFGLYGLGEAGYYKSNLDISSSLFDTAIAQQVWPENGSMETASVAVDVTGGDGDKIAMRLSQSATRCIIRKLYDCPKYEAAVAEEVKDMENWN